MFVARLGQELAERGHQVYFFAVYLTNLIFFPASDL